MLTAKRDRRTRDEEERRTARREAGPAIAAMKGLADGLALAQFNAWRLPARVAKVEEWEAAWNSGGQAFLQLASTHPDGEVASAVQHIYSDLANAMAFARATTYGLAPGEPTDQQNLQMLLAALQSNDPNPPGVGLLPQQDWDRYQAAVQHHGDEAVIGLRRLDELLREDPRGRRK